MYKYQAENPESEKITEGEEDNLYIYMPSNQKLARFEVTASTISDMICNYMTQTFYAVHYSETNINSIADGVAGLAPHYMANLYANESLLYRLT